MRENKILQLDDTEYIKTIEFRKVNNIKNNTEVLNSLEKKINELTIENDSDFSLSTDLLKQIKTVNKDVETYRKELVSPMNEKVKDINKSFKTITTRSDSIKKSLECKIIEYNKILAERARKIAEEARRKELAELEKQKEIEKASSSFMSDDPDPSTEKIVKSIDNAIEMKQNAPIVIKSSHKTGNSSTNIRDNWKFEIIDIDKIPKIYWSPDRSKIQNAIDLKIYDIPGIKIYNDPIVTSR